MHTHIESLARQKNFSQLTAAERTAVLSEMTEEDYEQLHLTISTLRSMDAHARPSPQLRERLLRHMAEVAQPRLPWHRRPVPMWQAAAAALLVGVAVAACFFPKKSPRSVEPLAEGRRETAVQVQHDTVWLTKWAYRDRVVYRHRPETSAEKQPAEPPQASLEMTQPADTAPADSLLTVRFALPAPPTGTPMSELPELMRFLGGERTLNDKR